MKVLNWENDLIDTPEQVVLDYCNTHCRNLEFEMLSGFSRRTPGEILNSLDNGVKQVVMAPFMLEEEQVQKIVTLIAPPLYGYVHGEDVEKFVFIGSRPKEIANTIISACEGEWDHDHRNPRNCFIAILKRASVICIGFEGERIEIQTSGWNHRDFTIVQQ